MKPNDRDEFGKVMDRLGKVFRRDIDPELIHAYWLALKDLDLGVIDARAHHHERYSRFFPKPYELRPKDEKPDSPPLHVSMPVDNWRGDKWDIQANLHLLAYFRRHHIPGGASLRGLRTPRAYSPNADATEEHIKRVHIFVAYKNAWAVDMREAMDETGAVDADWQKKNWDECMKRAEETHV